MPQNALEITRMNKLYLQISWSKQDFSANIRWVALEMSFVWGQLFAPLRRRALLYLSCSHWLHTNPSPEVKLWAFQTASPIGSNEAGSPVCSISSLVSIRTTKVDFCRVPHKQLKLLRQVPEFNIPNTSSVGMGAAQSRLEGSDSICPISAPSPADVTQDADVVLVAIPQTC